MKRATDQNPTDLRIFGWTAATGLNLVERAVLSGAILWAKSDKGTSVLSYGWQRGLAARMGVSAYSINRALTTLLYLGYIAETGTAYRLTDAALNKVVKLRKRNTKNCENATLKKAKSQQSIAKSQQSIAKSQVSNNINYINYVSNTHTRTCAGKQISDDEISEAKAAQALRDFDAYVAEMAAKKEAR